MEHQFVGPKRGRIGVGLAWIGWFVLVFVLSKRIDLEPCPFGRLVEHTFADRVAWKTNY